MKNLYPLLILLFLSLSIYAQSPDKMSYQAVVRDANNTLVANQTVGMQISILQSTITGTVVYTETHSVDTNLNGLVSLEIGTGITSGTFSEIDWSAGSYFIKTETDPTGGSSYTITGTSQLMSVPFALYATTSGDGITTEQSDAIETNTAKTSMVLGTAAETALAGDTPTITTVQADAIAANTAKVGYTEAAVSANTDVAANTAKVGYTEAAVSANTDVAANTAKVGYTEALVSANTDVAANTAKVGYTAAAVSANTDVAANTAKVGYTEAAVSANTDVAANTAKVGYTEAAVSANTDVAANTAKVGYTEAAVSANTDVAANTAKVGVTTHAIGDSFGGGIVFFVYDGGQHGLIAATADQSAGIRWYGGSNTNTRARADGIGAGLKNTAIIIANQGPVDGNTFAATVCNEYSVTVGGVTYGDWYLPSKHELNLLFIKKATVGGFTANFYWSSTEGDTSVAWRQVFEDGSQSSHDKYSTYGSVRAVRSF
jgi:hypothetical protein